MPRKNSKNRCLPRWAAPELRSIHMQKQIPTTALAKRISEAGTNDPAILMLAAPMLNNTAPSIMNLTPGLSKENES